MKIAVVFTNHLRTLPYTKEILKAFYPANTDYFLCSWSDNHGMLTLTEIKKLMEQHNIGSYIEFVDSKYAFHPLDFKELTEVQGFFNFKRVSTLTMEEFKLWHNKNLFKLFGDSKLYTTFNFYRRFVKQKAWEMIEDLRNDYDYIVFNRCDYVPISPNHKFTDYNFKKHDLYTNRLKISKGLLEFNDNIFVSKPNALHSFFENSFEKIETLVNSSIFADKAQFLKSHRLEGMLIFLSNIRTTGNLPFECIKVMKDDVINPISMQDITKIPNRNIAAILKNF